MNFSYYIARRYLFSKKSKNVVNIISGVALLGVVVGTTALVVVLSIFNGFDLMIKSFFSVFDPEIKITIAEGKQFDPNTAALQQLKNDPSVIHFCEVVEEIAHFRFEDRQQIAYIKGVDEEYLKMSTLDTLMYDGKLMLKKDGITYTVLGRGLAYSLGASANFVKPVYISVPKKGRNSNTLLNPFNQSYVFLSGIYEVGQQEVDDKYALVPVEMARELLDMKGTVTSIELALKPGTDLKKFQKNLQKSLGKQYMVQNRYQQHESYYKVAKSERFFIFLILAFILIIASFNLVSSIAMLILDKRKDINILISLGLTRRNLSLIFFHEGWLVSIVGGISGLALGILICLGQMHYGWIKFPGNFAVEYYPVDIRATSLVIIGITVLFIGALASWLPVKFLPEKFFQLRDD
ncbi:MAG TPA: FtsX-like permease family protein [Prolixibacteraceae bacterium]|nr:FtsX-like permease family protein [Prolixibacteraceae bacterium]HPS11991.1 FtsX-like permease family protein [Prolixibacteraceae bacterium]